MDGVLYPGLSVALVVLLMIALAGVGLWLQYRRTQVVQAWARSIGWTYVGTDPTVPSRWRTRPFGIGDSRRATELMTGIYQGRPATAFRYSYTTGSGKNKTTFMFHVAVVPLPAYLPNFELTPEGVGARLARAFGGEDIQFESEDFNRAWRVRAGVARFAHDVLHPRTMERLLRDDARGLSLSIEGTDLLCWTTGVPRWEALAGRLTVMHALIDAIPRYVWLDHGYDPENPGAGRAGSPRAV
jgi:hypothetical protein